MNLEEFRKALSSDATEENAQLKRQLSDLQTEYHEKLSKLENENDSLKESCRVLCNRCFTLTRGVTCLFCGLDYPCPHMPGLEEQVAMAHKLRKEIDIEAPYHALTNAGHISYVELDGDPTKNLAAFERVVRHMKEAGIGYGSINHPVDRDPICGYNGIINDVCPCCGRSEADGIPFERIRRITGYLVGTLDKWNDAKRAE